MQLLSVEVEGHAHPTVRTDPAGATDPTGRTGSWDPLALHLDPDVPRAQLDDEASAVAIADGLAIALAALTGDPSPLIARLDLGPVTVDPLETGFGPRLSDLLPHAVRAWLGPGNPPARRVGLVLAPDPPLFRLLREHAHRDPDLATSLGDGTLVVRAGLIATPSATGAAIDRLGLTVGEHRVPTSGPDRPPWIDPLCQALGARLHIAAPRDDDTLADAWLAALTDPDPARRARAHRARRYLADPPFHLAPLEVVRADGRTRLALGDDLVPLRLWGPTARDAAALVFDTAVLAPDILVVDRSLPAAWGHWLDARTHGDDATIVQAITPPDRP